MKTRMMRIIVNADDLGTSQEINNKTFPLIEAGLVTSATLIANGPAFDHACAGIRQFPHCSFGVHLNLTAFRPLSCSKCLAPILQDGQLSSAVFRVNISSELRSAIQEELIAQFLRVVDAGVPISHFDSHQFVHTIPRLFPAFKAVQRSFGVRKVRSTVNLLPPQEKMSMTRAFKKTIFRLAVSRLYRTKSPDGLGDFRDFHTWLSMGRMPTFDVLELMVHPGTGNPVYDSEIESLKSGWLELLPQKTRLISYREL